MRRLTTIICSLLLVLSALGQTVFDEYLANAKAFADAFPREKVHLHFDNTSYYQGDTIWFKAYVVDADTRQYSQISRPLYVELVDQMGNVVDRQIVKVQDGQAAGQISLTNTFFTGYYEVRAYTKWMLAFEEAPLFSRTFPIYRKPLASDPNKRSIAEYRMDKTMRKREQQELDRLTVNFYPEGGRLLKGVPTMIGMETVSRDSGWVNINGVLLDNGGQPVMPVATIHDGMGSFIYTPGDKPCTLEFEFAGKKRTFKLPKAEDMGYALKVGSKEDGFEVTITRSESMPAEPLALFIFAEGQPCNYVPVDLSQSSSKRMKILGKDLPSGVIRLALINEHAAVLNDRFCFVYPKDTLSMSAQTDASVYAPYSKVDCRVKVVDADGNPVAGAPVSLSLRDGIESDLRNDDETMLTDLLLTSELRGYIQRPGFYFANRSASRRKMLDNLLMIRGWRYYDLPQAFGVKEFTPRQLPEDRLMLYGRVRSYFQKSDDLDVTILAYEDSSSFMGVTKTDSLGYFHVPLEEFDGRMSTLIQTRKAGKKMNRAASVSLDRRFEPQVRVYDYAETNPEWDILYNPQQLDQMLADVDPYRALDDETIVLDELVVKAKNKGKDLMKDTEKFERSIAGYYNMRQIIDDMRDEGRIITNDIGNLMHEINPNINFAGTYYKADSIVYSIEGHTISKDYIDGFIDEIETAMLYTDFTGVRTMKYNTDNYRVEEQTAEDFWTGTSADTTDVLNLRGLHCRLDFTMSERFNPNKNYTPSRGVRKTVVSGYTRPVAFYCPQYPDGAEGIYDDRRRTLYWNPSLVTDENGEIHIDCYNSHQATYLQISAETLINGFTGTLTTNSVAASPEKSTFQQQ